MASTNQTGPLWVILRKRNRGEKHSTANWRRSAVAAKCSRFGCVFRQNQTGSGTNASKADDWVTLRTTELAIPSSRKIVKFTVTFSVVVRSTGQLAGAS
jgi:hypothetical protein